MADLSTKKDPLNLPKEKPDYVEDVTGDAGDKGVPPDVGTDPGEGASEGLHKPTVHLDEELVRKAEREGKGF